MPTYDYRCEATGDVYEVRHGMSESISTWQELCEKSGLEMGDIDAATPVTRLATGGNVVKSSSLGNKTPPCSVGGGCPSGGCGLN